ncbi:hypothetical protein [Ruminococcus sp.]|uniref:hypothetical protein n=1 Tax=Ruminococcus sp. TaxID=41978 RepID=UPI003992FA87
MKKQQLEKPAAVFVKNKKSNWFQRTSRRQRKSFSVQQFFKNAAEAWTSSPLAGKSRGGTPLLPDGKDRFP